MQKGFFEGAARGSHLEWIDADDAHQVRHLFKIKIVENTRVGKQNLGAGVIDQMMDVRRLEFVQQGNDHGTIGNHRKEAYAPVGLVAGTNGNFVSLCDAAFVEKSMKPSNFFCQIFIIERRTLVIAYTWLKVSIQS